MAAYLSLGSNDGDRRDHLIKACLLLGEFLKIKKISPIYETPALLLKNSPPSWNRPFLNLVLEVENSHSPQKLLSLIQKIEEQMGRKKDHPRWSPRQIDIDILAIDQLILNEDHLKIPHPCFVERDFFLFPFRDVAPDFIEPLSQKNILSLCRNYKNSTPAFMDIFNLTPDSFSDGGQLISEKDIEQKISRNIEDHVSWLDVGGCSTRPKASKVDPAIEIKRLQLFFKTLKKFNSHLLKISVDTFHPEVAKWALSKGVSMINDVSGFSNKKMADLLKESEVDYVLMHSLTIPANPNITMSSLDVVQDLKIWLEEKLDELSKHHIPTRQIIFDPGIGFGKTATQSLQILQNISEFLKYPVRLMVGHSKKSFMSIFSKREASQRSFESIGLSLYLAQKGVDIIRVHQAYDHRRALGAFQHGQNQIREIQ